MSVLICLGTVSHCTMFTYIASTFPDIVSYSKVVTDSASTFSSSVLFYTVFTYIHPTYDIASTVTYMPSSSTISDDLFEHLSRELTANGVVNYKSVEGQDRTCKHRDRMRGLEIENEVLEDWEGTKIVPKRVDEVVLEVSEGVSEDWKEQRLCWRGGKVDEGVSRKARCYAGGGGGRRL
ncbi:hypothetical protein Adt_11921 [Abeliophyllum distichum]|uniref:Uncharacterized protein n=1 Tax=Abeliophyllum distichum TaxID=126358 RepID=A0ABD1UPJ6_9LAMI